MVRRGPKKKPPDGLWVACGLVDAEPDTKKKPSYYANNGSCFWYEPAVGRAPPKMKTEVLDPAERFLRQAVGRIWRLRGVCTPSSRSFVSFGRVLFRMCRSPSCFPPHP